MFWITAVTITYLARIIFAQDSCYVQTSKSYGTNTGTYDTDKDRLDALTASTKYHRISSVKYCYQVGPLNSEG